MSYLHIHFGPIQPFIASARTTRDLWSGSFLLSTLSRAAIDKVLGSKGVVRIIRPHVKDDGSTPEIEKRVGLYPNYLEIEISDPNDSEGIAHSAFDGWNNLWMQISSKAFDTLSRKINVDSCTSSMWDRQVGNVWNQYWAFGTYHDMRRRKFLRTFESEPEPGYKCTLCGKREALHKDNASRSDIRNFWSELSEEMGPRFLKAGGVERLCAVCFSKRIAIDSLSKLSCNVDNSPFPSTASFATIDWRLRVVSSEDPKVKSTVESFLDALRAAKAKPLSRLWYNDFDSCNDELLRYDGDYFLAESYSTGKLPDISDESIPDLHEKFRELQRIASEAGIGLSSSYFAILSMDGDGMGNLLQDHPELKTELSKQMANFARRVPDIVEKQWGRVVYAGGDDVLAILPVQSVLKVARLVRDEFAKTVGSTKGLNRSPTISAGIILAPLTTPLQTLVSRSHFLLERVAKEHVVPASSAKGPIEKDAFAVEVWDRGGPNLLLVKKWDRVDGASWIDVIYDLADRLAGKSDVPLTNSFLYSCVDLLERQLESFDSDAVMRLLLADYLRSRDSRISELKESPSGVEKATHLIQTLLELARDDSKKGQHLKTDPILMLRVFSSEGRLVN